MTATLLLQKCSFRVDYTVESISREFGTVLVEADATGSYKWNLGIEVARAGWARVRCCRS